MRQFYIYITCFAQAGGGVWMVDGLRSLISLDRYKRVHLIKKKWQTGTLQGVMGQVVGCGVVNVMVCLFILVEHKVHVVVHGMKGARGTEFVW
jgi:hypothetical protein